ncbi:M43 family zinc metalloprotease [Dyadobacter subterraneus]|nr:M43 family zinc metalloprotease [Dyadobacter subterraneus]
MSKLNIDAINLSKLVLIISLLAFPFFVKAQERCATMPLLEQRFSANPGLRQKFSEREEQLRKLVAERIASRKSMKTGELVTVPVVFHVVMRNQAQVTDAQIRAQLDTINKDYAGLNAGASKIPSYFKSLFGSSGIQFCLAQRTPNDEPTTGIVRYSTTQTSFDYTSNYVKHSATGGATAWDPDSYLNIWICVLSNNTLGYATFPNDGSPEEQGVVIAYNSLPGGNATGFNEGKTLTHEIGHYFNLIHIWGDDNGSCAGSDGVSDTPNQGNSSSTCRTGVVTDNCTTTSPGIMYQNYMDYTADACLLMFTVEQVARMETAFANYRSILSSSKGCQALDLKGKDASIKQITQPDQRLCANTFTPQVILRNRGSETITSVTINTSVDNGPVVSYKWTGSLASYSETTVTLASITTVEGNHVLTVTSVNPNGAQDEDTSNDMLSFDFIYYLPSAPPIVEGFEGTFPPTAWDVVNPDGGQTWEKTTDAAKTGNASARVRNFDYLAIGQKDYLRSPTVNIAGVDSAFVSFQVAAATYTSSTTTGNVWDTLQVMISTDCGLTYTSLYKKWGPNLITRTAATRTAFAPTASEWRQEELNITDYISKGNVLIAFVNINGNENDIYLDDINIRTVTVNPNLKEAGFLVTPNPTSGEISVQFYPHPTGLQSITIYSVTGNEVAKLTLPSGEVSTNVFDFNLQNSAAGLYIVKAVFDTKTLTKKIMKY